MTLLPQLEEALTNGAARYYGRRRRTARAARSGGAVVAMASAVAAVVIVAGSPPADVERQAPSGRPPAATGELEALARAAGCALDHPRPDGRDHRTGPFEPGDYRSNPPAGGDHSPLVAADGVHEPDRTPELGALVHALEHGRINVQYSFGSPERLVERLEAFVEETDGRHLLLFENATRMRAQVAATAWGHRLLCDDFDSATLDALRAFRDRYLDKGPELVP